MGLTYSNEGATIRFMESLSFFTMPLSAFPKTFGLRELKKGFFPHLFNTPANQDYRGPIPDAEHYMPDEMIVDTRHELDEWYAEQVARGVEFHLKNELILYCLSDV